MNQMTQIAAAQTRETKMKEAYTHAARIDSLLNKWRRRARARRLREKRLNYWLALVRTVETSLGLIREAMPEPLGAFGTSGVPLSELANEPCARCGARCGGSEMYKNGIDTTPAFDDPGLPPSAGDHCDASAPEHVGLKCCCTCGLPTGRQFPGLEDAEKN